MSKHCNLIGHFITICDYQENLINRNCFSWLACPESPLSMARLFCILHSATGRTKLNTHSNISNGRVEHTNAKKITYEKHQNPHIENILNRSSQNWPRHAQTAPVHGGSIYPLCEQARTGKLKNPYISEALRLWSS